MPPRPHVTRLRERALEAVAESCREKLRTADEARRADEAFREAVANAARIGCSYEQIADAGGVTKARVGQIVKNRR